MQQQNGKQAWYKPDEERRYVLGTQKVVILSMLN